jgi:thioredoxin reductase (NADPH)
VVPLDERGYVIADETGSTEVPGFYVAGDARTKKLRQVVTAVADGANAATEAAEYVRSLTIKL